MSHSRILASLVDEYADHDSLMKISLIYDLFSMCLTYVKLRAIIYKSRDCNLFFRTFINDEGITTDHDGIRSVIYFICPHLLCHFRV